MKKKLTLFCILISTTLTFGQLLDENFDNGLPGNWTQGSADGISWTSNTSLGVGSSGCAIADYSLSSASGNAWLQTPFMDLSTLTNPEITFSVALVANNFVAPDVSLWYDNGAGWVQLTSWGNNISQTADLSPPLDGANVTWVDLNYDLLAVANNTNIRFSLGSDFTNGGWVLVDDVVIASGAGPTVYTLPYLQDFEQSTFLPQDWEAFGSNTNAAWQHSSTIGAYGNSSGSAFFDNFTIDVSSNFYGMRSVLLDLTSTTNPTLTFDVAYARRNSTNSDRLGIWYSFNGTSGWTNLIDYENSTLTTAPDQTTYFTPTDAQWDSITIDLTQFAGTPLIRFAFENNSNNGNVIYVDNVHFYEQNSSTDIERQTIRPFHIYPNPASDVVFINTNETEMSANTIIVSNLLGQKVQGVDCSPQTSVYSLDLSALAKGTYFISIITDDSSYTQMLFVE